MIPKLIPEGHRQRRVRSVHRSDIRDFTQHKQWEGHQNLSLLCLAKENKVSEMILDLDRRVHLVPLISKHRVFQCEAPKQKASVSHIQQPLLVHHL